MDSLYLESKVSPFTVYTRSFSNRCDEYTSLRWESFFRYTRVHRQNIDSVHNKDMKLNKKRKT